jgi:hypothetical protein
MAKEMITRAELAKLKMILKHFNSFLMAYGTLTWSKKKISRQNEMPKITLKPNLTFSFTFSQTSAVCSI